MIKTYIINLDRRTDRLQKLNIPFEWTRFEAFDGSIFETSKRMQGHFGCLNSHRNILNKIKLEKNGMTIILEDDVEICSDFVERLNSILDNLPDNWDLLYLGGWNVGELKKFTEGIDVAEKVYTTHAYIIRDKFIDNVLEHLNSRDWKVDVLLSESLSHGNCFICNPVLAWQREGFSDIEQKITNNKHLR